MMSRGDDHDKRPVGVVSRRAFLGSVVLTGLTGCAGTGNLVSTPPLTMTVVTAPTPTSAGVGSVVAGPVQGVVAAGLQELESSTGLRIGLSAIGTGNSAVVDCRGDELFPMCSTVKVLITAAVLHTAASDPGC